jgi:hypothetical protein
MNLLSEQDRWETKIFLIYIYHEKTSNETDKSLFCKTLKQISLTFISPKPSPKPSDVQLLSIRHVTKVHLLQKFLDPQKHALIVR